MPRWSPSFIPDTREAPGFLDNFGAALDQSLQREIARREALQAEERGDKRLDRRYEQQDQMAEKARRGQLRNILTQGGWRQEQPMEPGPVLPGLGLGLGPNPDIDLSGVPMHPEGDRTPQGYLRDEQMIDGGKWWRPMQPARIPAARRPLAAELGAGVMLTPQYQSGALKLRSGKVNELTPEETAALRSAGISPNLIAGATMSEPVRRNTPQATTGPQPSVPSDLAVLQAQARAAQNAVDLFESQYLAKLRTASARQRWFAQNPQLAAQYQEYIDAAHEAEDAILGFGEDDGAAISPLQF